MRVVRGESIHRLVCSMCKIRRAMRAAHIMRRCSARSAAQPLAAGLLAVAFAQLAVGSRVPLLLELSEQTAALAVEVLTHLLGGPFADGDPL